MLLVVILPFMNDYAKVVSTIENRLKTQLPGLTAQLRMALSFRGDFSPYPNAVTRNSAVLIIIYSNNGKAESILIKRTTYNGAHSGQISFPGGKQDDYDKSLTDTAIREAYEEIGINPDDVKILGSLTPLYIPVSNHMVLPVLGTITELGKLKTNSKEVEYAIKFPLEVLTNPKTVSVKTLYINGKEIVAPYFNIQNEMVWGATAMIISELAEIIKD